MLVGGSQAPHGPTQQFFQPFLLPLALSFPQISPEGEEWEAARPAPPLHLGMTFPKPNPVAGARTRLWIIPAQIVGPSLWGKPNNSRALIFN